MGYGSFFDFHDGIPGIGTNLVAGNPLFGDLIDDFPIRVGCCIFMAGQPLHGDVIVIHLAQRGNTVKANDPFQ